MRKPASPKHPRADSGFMLIEIMISSLILVIGLLSLLSLYTHAVATVSFSEDDLLAKQKAREALESLFTARNTSQISFSSIDSPESGGIFLSGPQPLRLPGPDGLAGTADDGDPEVIREPGPDGQLGTSDDVIRTLERFRREILVEAGPAADIKLIRVRVGYRTPTGVQRTYVVSSYVSKYR
ncbi:MAG: hypothetical protein WAO20_21725 [Acidobacteriota bacterium]